MVKIEEKSEKEREEKSKAKSMLEIAAEMFGEDKVSGHYSYIGIRMNNLKPLSTLSDILVAPIGNRILVRSREYFERAKQLAEAYETKIKEEFILKKDY